MSGQFVLISLAGPAGIPIAVGLAAFQIAMVVKAYRKQGKLLRKMEKNIRRTWEAQAEKIGLRHREFQAISRSMTEAAERLAQVRLGTAGASAPEEAASGERPRGFLDLDMTRARPPEDVGPLIEALDGVVRDLPASFRRTKAFQQAAELLAAYKTRAAAGEPPLEEELAGFQETLSRTVTRHHNELEEHRKRDEAFHRRAGDVLEAIGAVGALTADPAVQEELTALAGRLLTLRDREGGRPADLDDLARRVDALRETVDHELHRKAYAEVLGDFSVRRLEAMGYSLEKPFADTPRGRQAVFRASRGRLNLRISPQGRLDFNMTPTARELMAPGGLAAFREAEDRWCDHARELMRGLTEDGFSLQLESEESVEIDEVHLARFLTADDLAAEDEEDAGADRIAPRHREYDR